MYPRQYDLTDNFFPPESLGTNVFQEILILLYTFGILPMRLPHRTPYSKLSRCYCMRLQQFKLDVAYKNIIQRLKALIYKDFVSKMYRCLHAFRASNPKSMLGGICIPTPTLWARHLRCLASPSLYGVGLIYPQTP